LRTKKSWTPKGKLERRNRKNTQVKSCIIRDGVDDDGVVGDDDYDDDDHDDELLGTSVSTLKPTDVH
jgi:hypothetical protein